MLHIRPFDYSDRDYLILNDIDSALFPQFLMTVDEWKHQDASHDPAYLFHRDLIEADGQPIAFGQYGQIKSADRSDGYYLHVFVHPDHEHPDVRPAYYDHALAALADRQPGLLRSGTLDSHKADVRFWEAQGFTVAKRDQLSDLDVQAFDAAPFAPVLEQVRAGGIEIVTLGQFSARDPDWQHKLYDLFWLLIPDVPMTEQPIRQTLEQFVKEFLGHPGFSPDAWAVALDGDLLVGTSHLLRSEAEAGLYNTNLTGVLRAYRRRGIALALKVRLIEAAQRLGALRIITSNDQRNPMLQLNLRLGFVPRPSWVEYEKVLAAEAVV